MTFAIGQVRRIKKRLVLITEGEYIGGYDRISNHWSGPYLDKNGVATKKMWSGYGYIDVYPLVEYRKLEQRVIF